MKGGAWPSPKDNQDMQERRETTLHPPIGQNLFPSWSFISCLVCHGYKTIRNSQNGLSQNWAQRRGSKRAFSWLDLPCRCLDEGTIRLRENNTRIRHPVLACLEITCSMHDTTTEQVDVYTWYEPHRFEYLWPQENAYSTQHRVVHRIQSSKGGTIAASALLLYGDFGVCVGLIFGYISTYIRLLGSQIEWEFRISWFFN